jgi:hypothetical protein
MKTDLNQITAANVSALIGEDKDGKEKILLTGKLLFNVLKEVFPNLPEK